MTDETTTTGDDQAAETPPVAHAPLTLEALRAAASAPLPVFTYDCPELGATLTYRAANASEVESAMAAAKGSDALFRQLLINTVSIEPKITSEMWLLMGQLPATVRGRFQGQVIKNCGLGPEALADAKKPSPPTPGA